MYGLIDCNNFFVSCEKVFRPDLENKPVVVLSNNDGCVISRSNEAKRLGIKMGEPAFKIKDIIKKNNVKVFSTNYALYGDMSNRVMKIIKSIVKDVEIYSIDEAFIDLNSYSLKEIKLIGKKIKDTIKKWTGIPVAVGISSTKTLAKIASEISKKNNEVCVLENKEEIEKVLRETDISEVWGVGRQYSKFLRERWIDTAYKFTQCRDVWVRKNMNITGLRTVKELRGEKCISFNDNPGSRKSIASTRTFPYAVNNIINLEEKISYFIVRCAEKLRKEKLAANIMILFIKTDRFKNDEKQYSNHIAANLPFTSNDTPELIKFGKKLLRNIYKKGYKYKRAGVILSGLVKEEHIQQDLFDDIDRKKQSRVMKIVDEINRKMGRDMVRSAGMGTLRRWRMKQEKLSPCYTSRWGDILKIKI